MRKYITITFSELRILLAIVIIAIPLTCYIIELPLGGWLSIIYSLIGAGGLGLFVYSFRPNINLEKVYYGIVTVFTLIGFCLLTHLCKTGFVIDLRFMVIVYTIFGCLYLASLKELTVFLLSMIGLYAFFVCIHPDFDNGRAVLFRYIAVASICYVYISSKIKALEINSHNNEMYRKLFDNINEGIIIVDNGGGFLDINKKMLELTGYKREELIGGVSHNVFLFKEDIAFMQKQTEERKLGTRARYEIRVKKKGGGFIWCLISGIPMTNIKGETIGSMGVCTDITDLKAKNLSLKEKTEKLEKANKQLMLTNQDLEQFAYTASHDLQAPLRTIASFSQLLSKRYRGKIDEDANEYIDFIVDGCKKMSSLIHGVLDFAKTRTQELLLVEIDLSVVMASTIRQLHTQVREKGASVLFGELPVIEGDKVQIGQLMQNLIENALKYTREGIKPVIRINSFVKEGYFYLEVKDNGIGINDAFQDKIFKLFQRLHKDASYSGIGIGLSICKKIMENHNGSIHFESKEGEGTNFILKFPETIIVDTKKRRTALG